jgi:hypothetical protein
MTGIAHDLAAYGIATLRYQFPYMERGASRPDAPAQCRAAVRAAVRTAAKLAPTLALVAGSKSFGGRAAWRSWSGIHGLSTARAESTVRRACRPSVAGQDSDAVSPKLATLRALSDADHSFHVLVRSGRTDVQVRSEMLDSLSGWIASLP